MAKDDAIRNQKVFVTLNSVLELQDELARLEATRPEAGTPESLHSLKYRSGLARAINILGLPISIAQKY